MKIKTDQSAIEAILNRYTHEIIPTREDLMKKFSSGKRLKIYVGADPTGSNLHLGHTTNFLLLEEFRKMGHEVIVLFGDFTAMIGDPTDKEAARVYLTSEQVAENVKTYKEQVSKIVSFEGENPATVVKNSDWYSKMGVEQFMKIASNFTVQYMLERDMFEKRIEENKPIYIHEFFYPFMQGYDSVVLDVDVELGGTDQTFNMLAGRTLQQRYAPEGVEKNKIVISVPLIAHPKTGKKLMSKSEGSFIAILDTPEDMFGKIMAMNDESVALVLQYYTSVSMDMVKEIKEGMEKGKNPKELKMKVAFEVVKMYHDENSAQRAQEYFENTFSKKIVSEDLPEFLVQSGTKLTDFIFDKKLIDSKTEIRRLFDAGAISEFGKEKISDPYFILSEDIVIKVGKKIIFKVIVE